MVSKLMSCARRVIANATLPIGSERACRGRCIAVLRAASAALDRVDRRVVSLG